MPGVPHHAGAGSLWPMADSDDITDENPPRPTGRRSLGDRVRAGAAARPQPARTPSGRPVSAKRRIEGLEPRERQICFAAGALSLAMGVIIYAVETGNKHFRLSKDQLTPQTTLILGIIFAVVILAATWVGRRAPIGFVGLFAFLGFGLPYGLPFLALAVWLLYRSYRFQKEAAATAKADRAAQSGPPDRGARGGSAPTAGSRRGAPNGPSTPEANKRFTPKRPPPPPPKPSRRERKATTGD
jgi:hypothetical protein